MASPASFPGATQEKLGGTVEAMAPETREEEKLGKVWTAATGFGVLKGETGGATKLSLCLG